MAIAKSMSCETTTSVRLEIVEQAQQRADLAHEPGIERGRRLVEQDHVRLHGQRAGDGDALLLSAGESRRVLAFLSRQPHEIHVEPSHFLGL